MKQFEDKIVFTAGTVNDVFGVPPVKSTAWNVIH
jgi:hypothetical protein